MKNPAIMKLFHAIYIQSPGITELYYIFINGAFWPYISLIFTEITFRARNVKRTHS